MSGPFVDWSEYPLRSGDACGDSMFYRSLLQERAASIFTADASNIRFEVLTTRTSTSNDTSSIVALTELSVLERWLRDSRMGLSNEFYFLYQKNTRSRIQMTLEMFCLLCHTTQILPAFINIVTAFGFKATNIDEYFTTCYQQCFRNHTKSSDPTTYTRYDICFNIRYVEKHGRSDLTDPWSFRQTAIYQIYDFLQDRSVCVLIQSPPGAREILQNVCQTDQGSNKHSPLRVDLILLKLCAREWRWYLNYASECLRDMKDDITWARITKPQSNAGLDQSQSLEVLRWKLREACSILESNLNVGNTILRHAKDIVRSVKQNSPEAMHDHMQLMTELLHYVSDLRMYRRKALDLLDSTKSMDFLILKLLDLRNYDVSNKNVSALRSFAEANSAETSLMVQIARHTSCDSRAMKITSFIAVIFLPATLVSSIFSTDLVTSSSTQLPPRLMLLYAILTIILTSLTITGVYIWNRRAQGMHAVRASP